MAFRDHEQPEADEVREEEIPAQEPVLTELQQEVLEELEQMTPEEVDEIIELYDRHHTPG